MIGTQATRWDVLLAIGAGGALGSLARYGLSEAIPHPRGGFAVATLITNVVGCLLIGVLMGVLTTMARPHRLLRPFLGVGILGGFTTFSTYVIDTLDQLTTGRTELRVRLSRSLATGSRHRAGPGATMTALLVAIGGALGAILRYLTDHHVTKRTKPAFPWGTLTVNTAGSAILGVLTAWSLHGSEPDTLRANVLLTLACGFTAAALPLLLWP
jgi:CrcB protein